MSVIEEARQALNIDPVKLARVAAKRGIPAQEAVERIAYRRAVIDRGGSDGARMASIVLGRRLRGA